MKKLFFCWVVAGLLCGACSDDKNGEMPEPLPESAGYASPGGMLLLNGGARMLENGSLAYVAPDGSTEADVYRKVNGSELGNQAVAMDCYGGRLYILCCESDGLDSGNGLLIIADAETLKKEKAYRREEMTFARPEGCLQESERLGFDSTMRGIAVLDERNVFIADTQGLFRFDTTTDELCLIEGSYAFGNQGMSIEGKATPVGMLKVGDCLYTGASGFWNGGASIMEFVKGKNEMNRMLDLPRGSYISGLCLTEDGKLLVGTYERNADKSYLYIVDRDAWKVEREMNLQADLTPGFNDGQSSGIVLQGQDVYFAGGEPGINRYSLTTGRMEHLVDVKDDVEGRDCFLDGNLMIEPATGYVWLSVSYDCNEAVPAISDVLVYDCSGDTPRLVRKISDLAHYAICIYPM